MTALASADSIHGSYRRCRPLDPPALDRLVDLYAQILDEASAHLELGWRPAGGEIMKLRYPLDRERMHHFADFAYGGIGFEVGNDFLGAQPTAENPAPRIVKTEPAVSNARRDTLQRIQLGTREARGRFPDLELQWAALLHEAADIGGDYLELESATPPIRVSNQAARVSARAPTLAAWLGRAPRSLMEIGGGHGRFLRDCALLFPDARLILTDLPFNLIVEARYLAEYFGDGVNLCLVDGQSFDADARINLVSPWRLDRIDAPVEAVANFLSFQHMDAANLNWYGAAIDRLKIQHLFHQNRTTGRDGFDMGAEDYPFRAAFTSRYRETIPWGEILHPDGSRTPIDVLFELADRLG